MIIQRTKNTIWGTFFGIIQKMVALVFPFFIRTIFIKTLGAEYLGLSSLFTSILQVLNLAELGVGSALVFSMYAPIAENNEEKIRALLTLYRRYYRFIGTIVLCAGIVVLPFLKLFIKGDIPADINIHILYIMQLSSTVLSYWLFAYKGSLFQAHQRVDIISIITTCINLLQYTLQIIILLLFKNYYLFLVITILAQLIINIVIALLSNKFYPKYYPKGELSKQEKTEINNKVKDLFTAKIGNTVSNSFDTIIVSSFLGLTTLAIYQNYFYIVSSVISIILVFFTAIQAGVGNYLITNSPEEASSLLYNINYLVFFVMNICSCCLVTLYQPFMILWVGKDYLLSFPLVIMFVIYFNASLIVRPLVMFKDAGGIWKEDRFRPLITSIVNLCLNLVTVKWIGLYGVLGSTIVSFLLVGYPWIIHNVNNNLFSINIRKFIYKDMLYSMVTIASCVICYEISQAFCENLYIQIPISLAVSIIVPSITFLILFWKSHENRFLIVKAKQILRY